MSIVDECFWLYSFWREESVDDSDNRWQVSQERLVGSKPRARQDSSVREETASVWRVMANTAMMMTFILGGAIV